MDRFALISETKLDVMEGQARIWDAALLGLGRLLSRARRLFGG